MRGKTKLRAGDETRDLVLEVMYVTEIWKTFLLFVVAFYNTAVLN